MPASKLLWASSSKGFSYYAEWLKNLVFGNTGYSDYYIGIRTHQGLAKMSTYTFFLALSSLALASFVGIIIGSFWAVMRSPLLYYTEGKLGMFGLWLSIFSVYILTGFPVFIIGYLLLRVGFEGLIAASFSLAVGSGTMLEILRTTRAYIENELEKPYSVAAIARGISPGRTVFDSRTVLGKVFRNVAVTMVPYLIWKLPLMVSGAALVEVVFDLPGLGQALLDSIALQDIPRIMLIVMIAGIWVRVSHIALRSVYYLLDPRQMAY